MCIKIADHDPKSVKLDSVDATNALIHYFYSSSHWFRLNLSSIFSIHKMVVLHCFSRLLQDAGLNEINMTQVTW